MAVRNKKGFKRSLKALGPSLFLLSGFLEPESRTEVKAVAAGKGRVGHKSNKRVPTERGFDPNNRMDLEFGAQADTGAYVKIQGGIETETVQGLVLFLKYGINAEHRGDPDLKVEIKPGNQIFW